MLVDAEEIEGEEKVQRKKLPQKRKRAATKQLIVDTSIELSSSFVRNSLEDTSDILKQVETIQNYSKAYNSNYRLRSTKQPGNPFD